jgi:membrane-bound ClpP family serine protease
MPGERKFQLVGLANCLLGLILLVLAFVNPANGFFSLLAMLCFLVSLAFYVAAYRRLNWPRSR